MENITQVSKKRNLPKEVFLHLLAIITLYWSAISFITLLFQYINYFIPDVLTRDYYQRDYLGPLRFSISSLLIVFPVFIFVSWILYKSYLEDSEKRELKLRKWLLYFTIFAAALVIIGDLVATINTFLEGDITSKFIFKALSVLFVAALIFGYYIDEVRRERPSKTAKYFAWFSSAIVLIAVIGGFFIAGSPKEERLRRFDRQKIEDLQTIQANIVNYWQRKEKLPEKLADLNDPISGFAVPADPQTGLAYEYIVKDAQKLTFELCAVFNREGKTLQSRPVSIPSGAPYLAEYSQSWDHQTGRVCFGRTIDKQLYPLLNKNKD